MSRRRRELTPVRKTLAVASTWVIDNLLCRILKTKVGTNTLLSRILSTK